MRLNVGKETVPGAPWAFIAVMGVTGAGKSTFIKWATGDEDIVIGHDLNSCTSEIKGYTFHLNGYNVNLVDTPGFNDTFRTETEVLQDIADWLKGHYEKKTRLNGIIYLHSLANVRMEGSALRNLKMFRELCGNEPLKNVILGTTFWGDISTDDLLRREEQLRTTPEFWGDMLERGSTMHRLVVPRDALKIVHQLIQKSPVTLQIQTELVEDNKPLIDTAAGQTVNEELARLEQKHKKELEKVKQDLHRAMQDRDQEMQDIMKQQQKRLDKQLDKVKQQQDLLLYDRRADQRRMETEYQNWMTEMEERFERRYREELEEKKDFSFDEAVAMARANEGKLPVAEREDLEQKIAELEQQLGKRKRRGAGGIRFLFKALKVAIPATSMALLGFPILSPFGSGETLADKLFGGSGADAADEAGV